MLRSKGILGELLPYSQNPFSKHKNPSTNSCSPKNRKKGKRKRSSMADKAISVENIKAFWHSQFHDPDKRDLNMKMLRAVGLFAGYIVLMRQYGDLMAI